MGFECRTASKTFGNFRGLSLFGRGMDVFGPQNNLVTLMVDFYGKFVGKFSSYTEFMGNNYVHLLGGCQIRFGKYTMVSSNQIWNGTLGLHHFGKT